MAPAIPAERDGPAGREPRGRQLRAAAVVVALLASGTPLGAHDTLVDGDPTNDWIAPLVNDLAQPCCGEHDCSPLGPGGLVPRDSGGFRAFLAGNWFDVPDYAIVPDASPDGRPWACEQRAPSVPGGYYYIVAGVRCLLLPRLT